MSRGRLLGILLMGAAIVFLVIGINVAFDDQGDTAVGMPIIALGLVFTVIGAVSMSFGPRKKRGGKKSKTRRRKK